MLSCLWYILAGTVAPKDIVLVIVPRPATKTLLPIIGRLSMMPSGVPVVAAVAVTKMDPNLVAEAVEMVDAVVVVAVAMVNVILPQILTTNAKSGKLLGLL